MTWEHSSGEGIWSDYVNEKGEHSLKEHKPKVVGQYCNPEKHIYLPDIPADRLIRCITCGQERNFVMGFHKIVDGKLEYASSK